MGDCKRCNRTIAVAAMEDASSSGPIVSKKRKTTTSANSHLGSSDMQHHLPSSHYSLGDFPDITVSPVTSVNSAGTVFSDEFCSGRSPLSCCSSSEVVKELDTTPLDLELQTKCFETVDSTNRNFKSFSLLSGFSGDSEETTTFPAKSSEAVSQYQKMKTPPKEEIEEFFATAVRHEQKRFVEKYNFDIVRDMPLEGRYQWVRLH